MELTEAHAASLAEKLNALDLTPEETEILGQLLTQEESEVEGFANRQYLRSIPPVKGSTSGCPHRRGSTSGCPRGEGRSHRQGVRLAEVAGLRPSAAAMGGALQAALF